MQAINALFYKSETRAQADLSYPAQNIKIAVYGGARYLNISGVSENSALNSWPPNGEQYENWRIEYVEDGVFKIVNAATGQLISVENNTASANARCVVLNDNGSDTQKWRFVGVEKDFLGNDLYYRIANYANNNLVISHNTSTNGITLKNYSGANNQKWKINCDGLDGFAANCVVDEGEKAGAIGGLFGETVFVYDLAGLKAALLDQKPLTIVVAANIDNANDEVYDLRIEDNKTIIGSYSANRITDPRLRTDDYHKTEEVSHNIIIRNIVFNVANRQSVVSFAIYGSKNVWVDHCDFLCSFDLVYEEVGKFIWINRAEYRSMDPDFVTISYNNFVHRYWGVAFGGENPSVNRASFMYCYFESVVQRTPQLGNGKLHVLNDSYARVIQDANKYEAIKCGAGGQVYSDANRFAGYSMASGAWDNEIYVDQASAFKDTGSYTNKGNPPADPPYPLTPPSSTVTTWNPAENYGYYIIIAYGTNDVARFCANYAGTVSGYSQLVYINHREAEAYVATRVPSPVVFDYTNPGEDGDDSGTTDTINGGIYMIKNVNSNLYIDVADGAAVNGTNVQQWGASGAAGYNTWKAVADGNGYYRFYSQLGGGSTYLLDVANGNAASGTNIRIWQDTSSDAQLFGLRRENDGSYAILTKVTGNSSGLDVENGAVTSGANIQQWGYTGGAHQRWILERIS